MDSTTQTFPRAGLCFLYHQIDNTGGNSVPEIGGICTTVIHSVGFGVWTSDFFHRAAMRV